MAYINPYERDRQARERAAGERSLAEIYGVGGQGETPASAPSEEKDANVFRRVWDTVEDVETNVINGAIASVEGVADFTLGAVGAVGGIFSEKFRDLMKKAIQYNVTENVFVASQNKLHRTLTGSDRGEHSYLKDDGIVNNVARGIGGMLPAVVASIATFGAAAPAAVGGTAAASGTTAASTAAAAKAAQVASMATMATGAAGQASQEAYEDGAGFYGGQAYGLLRGATEAATEYALGGATKLITGGGMLPGVRKSVASVGIGRVAKAALEEGAEEGISELLDPATRTTYKGREALTEYRDPAFYRRVLQASRDGTLTGLAFQGTVGHAMGNTGRAADMQEISQELDTLAEKRRRLDTSLRLTDEADAAIGEAERENWRVAETVLQKATPEKRAALIKDYGLADRFGEDGSMTADFAASLDRRATVGQAAADGENGAPADSVGRIDRRTASMDADAEKVSAALGREGRTQFTDVDSLSKAGRENLKKVKRVMNVLGELSGGEVGNFVIASESVEDNGYYDPGTGYVVLGADVLENGIDGTAKKGVQTWLGTILHETAHGTENTDAWVAMTAKLREIDGGRYYTETLKELGNRGYLNGKAADIRAEFEKILRKMEKGEKLTAKQEAFADTFVSESGAIMAELALGNKHFARTLLDADASVVEKILHRIEDAREALARRKDPEAKKVFEEIRAAEGMFLEAVAESGFVYRDGKIVGANEDEEDEVKKSRKANPQTSGKAAAKTPETEHLTGMQKQTVAKYARTKVYTKAEALEIIEQAARMLDETYGFDGGLGEASGFVKLTKTVKDAAAVDLWKAYNSANTEAEKLEIARKLADTLMAEAQLVTLASDEELAEAREVTDCLRRYFHKIDLSGIDGEIKASGMDAKASRGRWSAKKGEQSFTADQLKAEIEGKLGLRIPADNEADIFFWMDEQYRKASEVIGNTNKALLFGNSNGERLAEDKAVRDQIAAEIVKSFKKGGQPSEWTKRLLYEVEPFYDKETEGEGINRAVFNAGKALNFARLNVRVTALSAGVKDWKAGTFLNQSQPQYQNIFKDTIGQLAKINRGGRLLDPVKCRELIKTLGEWYTAENMKAMDVTFNEEIDGYIKQISEGEGGLTVSDMKAMESVIEYMKHTAETYQTVWRNGKRVKALPVAREYVRIMGENQKLRVGKIDHIFSSWYMRLYGDPHMLVRYMDKYKNGFYTEMFERMRDGAMKAQIYRKRLEDQIAETMEKYPKYFKELEGRKILIHGSDMPVGEAMSLWMSLNRDQAIAGILENGYCFTDDDPKKTFRRVFGFTGDEVIRDKEGNILPQYRQKIEELQAEIWEQLSDADKAYIQIAYKLLNQDCKTLKRDTDMARMGYSNAIEDFYFPIRRANSAQDVDQQTFYDEISRVSNASFNKDTVKGAKNQLLIEPIQVVMERHMRGVTMYAALGTLIDDYKMLKNLNVDGEQNHNKPVSIATEEPNTWEEGRKYFEQLMADIQGIKPNSDEVTRFVGKLRGHYARAVLSANPKVIATQLSSLFAGMNIIDADCMKMMFSDRGRDVFTYSELAELRASENTAAMAQGLLDEAGDFLMKPIGATDAWVVRRLFVAAQYQVAKDQKLQVGTEENKKVAGKLLERVIFETQQNSLATEKSQAARSASEFQKMMTMFTSDAVKGAGQLLDAIGEITTIRNEAKVSGQPINKDRLRQARKRAGRAAASLGAVAVYSALLAVLIKKLLDRDDEWGWGDFLSEIGAGLLGGLPIVKEIYDGFFGAGYGVEDMSVEAVNDLMESTKGGFDAMGSFVSGDLSGREAANATRKLIYAIGNVAGLPARNSYTWSRRLVGIFSPDAAYKMEDFFVAQSYRSDIAKAVASGDESRLETVIGVMLDTNVGEVTSSDVRQEMKRLVSGGMDVLPRGVGDTVTVDGETVKLTETQKRAFRAVYSEANKSVEKMVGLAYYADASDEAKAKAIKRVYGIYYNRAIEDLLGVELENRNTLLSRAVDPEVLAVVLAVCGEMQADVGKDGKPVANSKRKKVEEYVDSLKLRAAQKYIIMGALGYKNKLGKEKVEAYVRGLGLTTSEIEAMIGFSGY